MSKLFEPFQLGSIHLPNRIVIAPMCQYSAQDGCMTDWHLIHLGHLALSGAAVLTIEATAVSAEGRITYADVGLYSDEMEACIARTIDSIRRHSPITMVFSSRTQAAKRRPKFLGSAARKSLQTRRTAGRLSAPVLCRLPSDTWPPLRSRASS